MITALDPVRKNNVTVFNPEITGQPMIFAHGFGTSQGAWQDVVLPFKNAYRIVLYDNVGGGKSDPAAFSPNKYDSLETYADDLIDICDACNLRNGIMVAHSVSCMISLLASVKRPDLFDKLVMVGASPRYLDDINYVGGFTRAALDGLFQSMANNYFAWVSGFAPAAMANAEKPELAASFAESLSAIRPDIAQSVAKVIFLSDHRQSLSLLKKKTLLLQTKQDIAVPLAVAEYLQQHIEGSELKIVNAEGHFPHISAPAEIIHAIQNFIR